MLGIPTLCIHQKQPNAQHILSLLESPKSPARPRGKVSIVELNWQLVNKQKCTPCKQTFCMPSSSKMTGKQIIRKTKTSAPCKNNNHERIARVTGHYTLSSLMEDSDPFDQKAKFRRRQMLQQITRNNRRNKSGTPPPVSGRRHEVVQTNIYLERLAAGPNAVCIETQTDLFLEKPPIPPYAPAKIGIDVATEIQDGELFHFDAEAQPIIDAMVDSVLELSILEVAHEQQISAMRKKQERLMAEREKELAEIRRLEEEELRLQAEKVRRLRQDKITKALDHEMQQRVLAAKLLQGHIASILPQMLLNMDETTEANNKNALLNTMCPWLSREIEEEMRQIVGSREILTAIIREVVEERSVLYGGYERETYNVEFLGEEEDGSTQAGEMEAEEKIQELTCE